MVTSNPNTYIKNSYNELALRWKKNKIFTSGQDNVRAFDISMGTSPKDRFLIPFSENMEQEKYQFYVSESEFPGFAAEFARLVVNGLTRKEPIMKLGFDDNMNQEIREWILSDFGEDGMPFLALAARVIDDYLKTDHAWVYVETPDEDGEMPRAKYIHSENVVNWQLGDKDQLTLLVTRSYVQDPDSRDEFNPEMLPLYTIHRLKDGIYNFEVLKEDGTSWDGSVKMGVQYNGKPLDFIPAWPIGGNICPGTSVLQPIIDKDVSLYNKMSRRNHLLYGSTAFTPIVYSDKKAEDINKYTRQGLGRWLHLGKEDKAEHLAMPTEGLKYMQEAISDNIDEMGRMGIRMLSPEGNQSGVALQLRNASQVAKLGAVQTVISNTFSDIIRFMISFRYKIDVAFGQFDLGLSDDFQLQSTSKDILEFFTGLYERSLVPRSEWLRLLHQNGLISDNYDDEKGKLEIAEDEMVAGGLMNSRNNPRRQDDNFGQQNEPDKQSE